MSMVAHGIRQRLVQIGPDFSGVGDQVQVVNHLQVRDTGSGTDRMCRIGPAVANGAELVGAVFQNLPDLVRDDRPRQRRIGRSQALGDGDDIRLDAVMLRAKHGPQPSETGDDLVGDQQDIVFLEHRLNRGPVACRRRNDTARSQHGFADESRNRIRTLGEDQFFKLGGTMGRELFLGLVHVSATEVIRRFGMDHLRQRQVKFLVEQLQPGQ